MTVSDPTGPGATTGNGTADALRPASAPGTAVAGRGAMPATPATRAAPGSVVPPLVAPAAAAHPLPERPALGDKAGAPVLVKLPPPFTVRVVQLFWILSFAVGVTAVVYLFIIRIAQLPDIQDRVRDVDGSRATVTYESAASIVYWSVFAGMVAVLLLQVTLFVSFSNRRPKTRWWQLGTVVLQVIVLLLGRELVAIGERGRPLALLLLIQLALAVLALLVSVLPPAFRWSARRHDVRRGADPLP